jgi:hypothetical protein
MLPPRVLDVFGLSGYSVHQDIAFTGAPLRFECLLVSYRGSRFFLVLHWRQYL